MLISKISIQLLTVKSKAVNPDAVVQQVLVAFLNWAWIPVLSDWLSLQMRWPKNIPMKENLPKFGIVWLLIVSTLESMCSHHWSIYTIEISWPRDTYVRMFMIVIIVSFQYPGNITFRLLKNNFIIHLLFLYYRQSVILNQRILSQNFHSTILFLKINR